MGFAALNLFNSLFYNNKTYDTPTTHIIMCVYVYFIKNKRLSTIRLSVYRRDVGSCKSAFSATNKGYAKFKANILFFIVRQGKLQKIDLVAIM